MPFPCHFPLIGANFFRYTNQLLRLKTCYFVLSLKTSYLFISSLENLKNSPYGVLT